ncbi:hypothetical protein [Vallitalea guaymasensis]|uniref:hypothetical protein n=1 Tax=Vallitalea guaymasensis TaxID=1185412 RepID=UPI002354B3AE|nr:hypothetical protein [Vallitalea guaymasensis]
MDFCIDNNVLIIDDNYKEALPVIQALAIKGISTIYWDGNYDTKPEKRLTGIRLAFLDMRFSAVTDQRSVITNLFTLLRNAISLENGPYILYIWSKHDNEYLDYFKKEISELPEESLLKPYMIINIEKSNFIDLVYEKNNAYEEIATTLEKNEMWEEIDEILKKYRLDINYEKSQLIEGGIEKLYTKIIKAFKSANALAVLLMWEKIVNQSAKQLINEVAEFSNRYNWDNNIKTLIQQLAIANAGEMLGEEPKDYVLNALASLNLMLPDQLSNQLLKNDFEQLCFECIDNPCIKKTIEDEDYSITMSTKKKFTVKNGQTDFYTFKKLTDVPEDKLEICKDLYFDYLKLLGQSNFKMLCERYNDVSLKPGRLFKINDEELLKDVCNGLLVNQEDNTGLSLIGLDISSSCDYAQNKLKRTRIVFGLMIEDRHFMNIQKGEDIYNSPVLDIEEKIVKIVFSFHFISSYPKGKTMHFTNICTFRDILLTEIRHKISTHLSRVGIINL